MNDESPTPPAGAGVAIAKGIALGLGVLLIGGTALLVTLLVVRQPETPPSIEASLQLQAGEKVTAVSLSENRALFLIEASDGGQRAVVLDLATGAREPIPILPF